MRGVWLDPLDKMAMTDLEPLLGPTPPPHEVDQDQPSSSGPALPFVITSLNADWLTAFVNGGYH